MNALPTESELSDMTFQQLLAQYQTERGKSAGNPANRPTLIRKILREREGIVGFMRGLFPTLSLPPPPAPTPAEESAPAPAETALIPYRRFSPMNSSYPAPLPRNLSAPVYAETAEESDEESDTSSTTSTDSSDSSHSTPRHDADDVECRCYECVVTDRDQFSTEVNELRESLGEANTEILALRARIAELTAPRPASNSASAPAPAPAPRPAPAPAKAKKVREVPLHDGEEVRVYFGTGTNKVAHSGHVNGDMTIDGLSPSAFAKAKAKEHFGADHALPYNGWIKCFVEREDKWVTLDSLRNPPPMTAEQEEAILAPV